jgi:predicted CoA-binding protein
MDKKTMILGATTDTAKYANMAASRLSSKGYTIVNIGIKTGEIAAIHIEKPETIYNDIDTIALYINPLNQPELHDYILLTNPKRIIFNPGTENTELQTLAKEKSIEVACTLVLITTGQYQN